MERFAYRVSHQSCMIVAGVLVSVLVAACATTVRGVPVAAVTKSVRYVDSQGWSLRYPGSLFLERSASRPGAVGFSEVTVANFAQRRAVVTRVFHDGGSIIVNPPLDHAGRFPADGIAFRMMAVGGGPAPVESVADSAFPVELSTFSRPRYRDFAPKDYTALGVPQELSRPINADDQDYQAQVLIGSAVGADERAEIAGVIASLTFPALHTGEQAGTETVLGLATSYPVGSFTLIHAQGELCDGSVEHCHAGQAPFYLVHAPGQLHQPDLIDPCHPTAVACTPPGAFYAIGWTDADSLHGYRSGCQLRLDKADKDF